MAAGMTRIKGDQTPEDWLRLGRTGQELGTLVFIRSVDLPKEFKSDITYDDAIRHVQQESASFFKWVPFSVAAEATVASAKAGGRCNEYTQCPPGCLCVNGHCR